MDEQRKALAAKLQEQKKKKPEDEKEREKIEKEIENIEKYNNKKYNDGDDDDDDGRVLQEVPSRRLQDALPERPSLQFI